LIRARPVLLAAAAVVSAALSIIAAAPASAATMIIDDADPAGQGLNDPTPVSPVGGNPATTLGAARLAVFQQAASIWGSKLASPVDIRVSAQFLALPCSASSATLAATGANTVHRNFTGAPVADTWYPQALANALAGQDLDSTSDDIVTEFNSSLGLSGCMPGTTFYLGLDGLPGSGQVDMLTVLLHELAHGLGFQTFEDVSTGATLSGFNDAFLLGVDQLGASPTALSEMTDGQRAAADVSDPNLYWSGSKVQGAASRLTAGLISGHVRLYAPSTILPGSSVSHFSTALTPSELMAPSYTGPNRNLGLTVDLLLDLGWQAAPPLVPAVPKRTLWLLAGAIILAGVYRFRRPPATDQ
jgi:hypothetical protein